MILPKVKVTWKMNCHYLRHDADFVAFLKGKIFEFKEVHRDTDCDPHVVWDAFKCTITGHCIQYYNSRDDPWTIETWLEWFSIHCVISVSHAFPMQTHYNSFVAYTGYLNLYFYMSLERSMSCSWVVHELFMSCPWPSQ